MTTSVLSLNIALPSEFASEATAGTASDWLVIQKSGEAYVRRIAATATALGGAALAGSLAQGFSSAHIKLPTTGQVGFWDGAAWSSRIDFTSGYATLYSPMVEVRNLADSAYSDLTGRYLYADEYRCQSDTNTGITFPSADTLTLRTGGSNRCGVDASGHLIPVLNNTYNLGSSAARWNYLYATNLDTGTILPTSDNTYRLGSSGAPGKAWNNIYYYTATSVSDETLKKDIADGDLGLDFVNALRPVKFRWRVGEYVPTGEDGADGQPVLNARPGVRFHYGLVADDVKVALKGKDFGGYVEDVESGRKGLRYDQLVSVLIKALQELHGQVKEERAARLTLEERVATLETLIKRVK